MKEIKKERIPNFKTLDEEKEYWEAQGPLAEENKGTINKPRAKQKRSSFLAVRLTGEELTRLRDMADKQGVGPSTFARMILSSVIKHSDTFPNRLSLNEIIYSIISRFTQEDIEKCENFIKDVSIGESENPALFVFSGQKEKWEEIAVMFFERLFGVQVIPTKEEDYQKIIKIAEPQIKED